MTLKLPNFPEFVYSNWTIYSDLEWVFKDSASGQELTNPCSRLSFNQSNEYNWSIDSKHGRRNHPCALRGAEWHRKITKPDAQQRSVANSWKRKNIKLTYYQEEYRLANKGMSKNWSTTLLRNSSITMMKAWRLKDGEKYWNITFLGPIILSHKNGDMFVVDGQQRLTTPYLASDLLAKSSRAKSKLIGLRN